MILFCFSRLLNEIRPSLDRLNEIRPSFDKIKRELDGRQTAGVSIVRNTTQTISSSSAAIALGGSIQLRGERNLAG
jgi:hypothetical protein